MKRLILAGALLVVGCGGAAPSAMPSQSTAQSVAGTVTFTGPTVGHTDCHGVGAYADMAIGTDILIIDGSGATIGKGKLALEPGGGDGTCVFGFDAANVPDVPFYTFQIGEREAPTYSNAEMVEMGWTVALAIGG